MGKQKTVEEAAGAASRDELEEGIVKSGLVFPVLSETDFDSLPAGVISRLSDYILAISGFGDLQATPTTL